MINNDNPNGETYIMITIEQIEQDFPFLALLRYLDSEYIGIISNSNEKTITFYNFDHLKSKEERQFFLELGNIWWWESNRKIPINIFMQGEMKPFNYAINTFSAKHTVITFGYSVSLCSLLRKTKKKTIQLVRKT